MLKNIISSIVLAYKRIKLEKIINKYDEGVNHNGFIGYKLIRNAIPDVYEGNFPQITKYDLYGNAISREIDANLADTAVIAISQFKNDILTYLGMDVRLDDMYLSIFNPNFSKKRCISGFWHDDNCGNRLKVYICLKGDGRTPTIVIPKSHLRRYKYGLVDFTRMLGINKSSKNNCDQIKLDYKSGDIAVFDTHIIHRGCYEDAGQERVSLVLEFMNRQKSNAISGSAPCGPGSFPGGRVLFIGDALNIMSRSNLLDSDLLKRHEDGVWSYSLANLI